MVEKFKAVLAELLEAHTDVSLFAALKMDDVADRWSIIYSAPGLEDEATRRSKFEYLVGVLLQHLTEEERKAIARVGVFPLSNHLVRDLMRYKKDYIFTQTTSVNGNLVHEGYILESRDVEADH